MSVYEFPFSDLFLITPFAFGAFGFLKKILKKVKSIGNVALNFVPGGGVIKQGLGVAKFGIGALVRSVKGKPSTQQTRQPVFSQVQSGFSTFGQPKILGINRNVAIGIAGVLIVGFIFFNSKK